MSKNCLDKCQTIDYVYIKQPIQLYLYYTKYSMEIAMMRIFENIIATEQNNKFGEGLIIPENPVVNNIDYVDTQN